MNTLVEDNTNVLEYEIMLLWNLHISTYYIITLKLYTIYVEPVVYMEGMSLKRSEGHLYLCRNSDLFIPCT